MHFDFSFRVLRDSTKDDKITMMLRRDDDTCYKNRHQLDEIIQTRGTKLIHNTRLTEKLQSESHK